MKDFGFKLKVSDLLNNPGSTSIINFKEKFTNQIENLNEKGISGTIKITGLNENSVLVELKNIKTIIDGNCDICGKNILRKIEIDEFSSKFVGENIKTDDDEFLIDKKTDTIDIEDLIIQSILLKNPIIIKCNDCENLGKDCEKNDNFEDDDVGNKMIFKFVDKK